LDGSLIREPDYLGKHCMEKRALCGCDARKPGTLAKPIKKCATLRIFGKERKCERVYCFGNLVPERLNPCGVIYGPPMV